MFKNTCYSKVERRQENPAGRRVGCGGQLSDFLDFFFGSFLLYQDKRNEQPVRLDKETMYNIDNQSLIYFKKLQVNRKIKMCTVMKLCYMTFIKKNMAYNLLFLRHNY